MAIEIAKYETSKTNVELTSGASEIYFSDSEDKANVQKFGSFNFLEVANDSSSDIDIFLDGLTTRRRRLFGRSVLVIKADQGIFFNTLKITEQSALTIDAGDIRINGRIVKLLPEV